MLQVKALHSMGSWEMVGTTVSKRRLNFGSNRISLFQLQKSGKTQGKKILNSRVPKCFGGTICTVMWNFQPHHVRNTGLTGSKRRIVTPIRVRYGMNCKKNWVHFPSSTFGGPGRISNRVNGSL